jgi:polysaccharide export outer membrane protein
VISAKQNWKGQTVKCGNILVSVAILLCVILLNGCFSSNEKDIAAFKKPYEVNVTTDKYILQPADQILVICPKFPELNFPEQRIRPDGMVSYPTLGEIEVAGKTPKEVGDAIQAKASKLYIMTGENLVDVRVTLFQSHVYYVLGMVDRPGPRLYTGRDQALRAIAEANPNAMAWTDRIQVIHPSNNPAEKPAIFELKWDPMVAHGDARNDVLLSEGDIIYVPPTVLAAIGMKLEELLTPVGRAFSTANLVKTASTTP